MAKYDIKAYLKGNKEPVYTARNVSGKIRDEILKSEVFVFSVREIVEEPQTKINEVV
jgi:hypothetical protein